jgi:hypothetical protein
VSSTKKQEWHINYNTRSYSSNKITHALSPQSPNVFCILFYLQALGPTNSWWGTKPNGQSTMDKQKINWFRNLLAKGANTTIWRSSLLKAFSRRKPILNCKSGEGLDFIGVVGVGAHLPNRWTTTWRSCTKELSLVSSFDRVLSIFC